MASFKFTVILTCLVVATSLPYTMSLPTAADEKPRQGQEQGGFGNLKYTFGSKDEIPAAFFESAPAQSSNSTDNSGPPPSITFEKRRAYKACQDGSGGMCVDAGTCPSNLKPESPNAGACPANEECCFGPPTTDKSCASRGGECRQKNQCGSAPTYQGAQDCDKKKGEVCCILTN